MSTSEQPLTLGTAGHVDHGKTSLIAALTGVDTDRLPEEKARGLTIVLGYAPLRLPGGRRLSVVDVPGHERFVRTMVAGASGIDVFLLVVAADDGAMPQTVEHVAVLAALGVQAGVVAVTKSDLADPGEAVRQVRELLPGTPAIPCSARTGAGLDELLAEVERVAATLPGRAEAPGPVRLHVDRAFTVRGRGTVATGTLWSGEIGVGDELELAPRGLAARVRGLQVHDLAVESARAGQRVAVNLAGVRTSEVERGDVLATPATVRETHVLDCCLRLRDARHGERVQVHHGTRSAPARLAALDGELWQVRLEQPLLALDGDRIVVRRLAPPDTLGGGAVLDARARRHGPRPDALERLRALRDGKPAVVPQQTTREAPSEPQPPKPEPLPAAQLDALEARLREAGAALLSEAQAGEHARLLGPLRREGRATRVSGRLYAHPHAVADVRERIVALIEERGPVTLAGVRDALGLSRKSAQAFLEHLDSLRVTRRLPDDTRVLARERVA